jgi:hypothetical protein
MLIAVVPVTRTSMPYLSRTGAAALRIDETRLFVASVAGPLFGVTEMIEMSPVSLAARDRARRSREPGAD